MWSRRLLRLGASAAAVATAAVATVYRPAPDYASDRALVALADSLVSVARPIGDAAEFFGLAQSEVLQRKCTTNLAPSPKSTRSVTFNYRQFSDSNTLVATPANESRRSGAAVIFVHGGAWCFGSPELYSELAAELVDKLGVTFFGIRYRLAPEHPFPAAFDDSLAAVEAIFDEAESMGIDRSRIAIAGDSAGGQLTAAIVQHLRMRKSRHRPKAQVLVYPATQLVNLLTKSATGRPRVPFIDMKLAPKIYSIYFCGDSSKTNTFLHQSHVTPKVQAAYLSAVGEEVPLAFNEETRRRYESPGVEDFVLDYRASPLLNPDVDSLELPPALLIACQFDPIRDDSLMYAKRLERAGAKVELKEYQTYHAALTMPNDGKEMRADISDFLERHLF